MIDKFVIRKKVKELETNVKELQTFKQIPQTDLFSSLSKQWMVCHGLQLSIQIIIDVGNHILAALGENRIEDYVDIIDRLGEKEIIPQRYAERIRGMAGLRNILVHEYAVIDLENIYDIVQNRLQDFDDFIRYIGQFLQIH